MSGPGDDRPAGNAMGPIEMIDALARWRIGRSPCWHAVRNRPFPARARCERVLVAATPEALIEAILASERRAGMIGPHPRRPDGW